jgi:hypothetical protein
VIVTKGKRTKNKAKKPAMKPKKPLKEEKPPVVEEKPAKRVDIDVEMYRDLFKFLDEKVSVECFIDLHNQCYGNKNCECQCHSKK